MTYSIPLPTGTRTVSKAEAQRDPWPNMTKALVTMDDTQKDDRQIRIARLVGQGHMTKEMVGQHVNDKLGKRSKWRIRGAVPQYDLDAIFAAVPDILQMDFDETDGKVTVTIMDGKTGDPTVVPLGDDMPETTEDLLHSIQSHFGNVLDRDSLQATRDVLAEFDD